MSEIFKCGISSEALWLLYCFWASCESAGLILGAQDTLQTTAKAAGNQWPFTETVQIKNHYYSEPIKVLSFSQFLGKSENHEGGTNMIWHRVVL